jgi:hypothetical protein
MCGIKMNKLLATITLLCFSVAATGQETEIKEVQQSYVEDFIAFDYDGMTAHFTYPVMIMGSTTRILENPEALINYYKSLISELPENYSHSTTEVEVRKINNSTWLLVSTFYRYNTNGDMFQSGTTQNFYIETNDGWKMFLRQSTAL